MLAGDRRERPRLLALTIGGSPDAWRALGFTVDADGLFAAGDTVVRLDPDGPRGIRDWALTAAVTGLPTGPAPARTAVPAAHPNHVTGIDHVVVTTSDLSGTTDALVAAGCEVRGERTASIGGRDVVQRFLPLQNALVELVAGAEGGAAPNDVRVSFWGITFVCTDLAVAAVALGPGVGSPRPAVQPGRQIAVAGAEAGLGTHVAFMSPRAG